MNTTQYAKRLNDAILKISELADVDLSPTALPKAPNVKIRQLFILEAIAGKLETAPESEGPTLETFLEEVERIDGVGPATKQKIQDHFYGA